MRFHYYSRMKRMRLDLLVAMVTIILLSCTPVVHSAPCSASTIAMSVGTTAELQNMTNALNCTGGGAFDVTWTGSLQLEEIIELSDNKNVTVTGSSPLKTGLPSDGIDAGNATGIFSVSGGSTLRIQNLVLEGGSAANGGGVDVRSFSSVYVDGCFFSNNSASTGGAIYANQSEIHVNGETVFQHNSAYRSGGAIYAEESDIHVDGTTWFATNSANDDAGVLYALRSYLHINGNTTFQNNTAGRDAGRRGFNGPWFPAYTTENEATRATRSGRRRRVKKYRVFFSNNCSTYFTGTTTFRHNAAQYGGAINANRGSETHLGGNSSFANNFAGQVGGAIRASDSNIYVGGHSSFVNNVAGESGGAISSQTAGVYISGEANFALNSAVADGGAVHGVVSSLINITGYTSFDRNSAGNSGGAFFTVTCTCYIDGETDFTRNTADASGGALSVNTETALSIEGMTSFSKNFAVWNGGAILVVSSRVSLDGSTSFLENSAYEGGAVVALNSAIDFEGNTSFSSSSARANGGAINSIGSNATIMGLVTFSSNTALNGGAIYCGACPKLEVLGMVHFVQNSALLDGGALSLTDPTEVNLVGTSFVENEAEFGGAVSLASTTRTTAWFERCQFDSNHASDGGALYLATDDSSETGRSTSFVQDSVFRHNVAYGSGGALFNIGPLAIDDTVFSENTAADGGLAVMNENLPLGVGNATFAGNMLSCPPDEYSDFDQGSSGGCRLQLVCEECFGGCEVNDSIATITSDTIPSCTEIPVGVSKLGTTTLETFDLLAGYYRVSAYSRDILECYRKESCTGGDNALNYCATGYAGPYCAVCEDAYSPGMLNSCHKCSTKHRGLAMGLAAGVLVLAIAVAVWLLPRLLRKSEGGEQVRCWDTVSSSYTFTTKALPLSAIKIVVVVLQIVTQFTEIAGAVYPDEYEAFLSKMTAINLDIGFLLSNLCIVKTDFYDRLLLSTVGPLVIVTALCGSYIVRRTRRNTEMAEALRQRNHLAAGLFIAFFVYSSVSFTIFQTFVCEGLDDGNAYLRADYSVQCWTEKHNAYRIYASVMVCIYPVGIPALFGWWLACNRRELEKPDRQAMENLPPFRGLWSSYKPSCYYYEVVECSRRVVLTGAAVFVLPNSADQIAVVLLIAVVFMFISESLSPFENKHDMWLYRLGNAIILVSMYVALLFKVDLAGKESQISMVATSLLIAANAGMIVTVIVQAVVMAKQLCISRRVVEDVHSARSQFVWET